MLHRLHVLDLRQTKVDAGSQLLTARANDLLRLLHSERHEQQAGLVDVAVVPVEDDDLGCVAVVAAEAVGRECSSRAAADDHDARVHGSMVAVGSRPGIRTQPDLDVENYARSWRKATDARKLHRGLDALQTSEGVRR
jgi:hypothetical protein